MGLFNAIMALSGAADIDIIEDERMSRHTTYRVGGPASLFITCQSYHGLRRAVEVLSRDRFPGSFWEGDRISSFPMTDTRGL